MDPYSHPKLSGTSYCLIEKSLLCIVIVAATTVCHKVTFRCRSFYMQGTWYPLCIRIRISSSGISKKGNNSSLIRHRKKFKLEWDSFGWKDQDSWFRRNVSQIHFWLLEHRQQSYYCVIQATACFIHVTCRNTGVKSKRVSKMRGKRTRRVKRSDSLNSIHLPFSHLKHVWGVVTSEEEFVVVKDGRKQTIDNRKRQTM